MDRALTLTMVLSMLLAPSALAVSPPTPSVPAGLPVAGPATIAAGETRTYANGTFYVLGNIEVQPGGALVLDHATLVFAVGAWTLHVAAGADITARNSTTTADIVGSELTNLSGVRYDIVIDPGAHYHLYDSNFNTGHTLEVGSVDGDVSNNTFVNNTIALHLNETDVSIANNTFVDNEVAILIDGGSPTVQDGHFYNGTTCIEDHGSSALIQGNDLHDCATGIDSSDGSPILRGNTVTDRQDPIHDAVKLLNANSATLEGNDIEHWGTGLYARNSTFTLANNIFNDTDIAVDAADGMNVLTSSDHDTYSNSDTGLQMQDSDATISNGTFENDTVGLDIVGGAPTMTSNRFVNDQTCARDAQATTTWDSNEFVDCVWGVNETDGTSTFSGNKMTDRQDPIGHALSLVNMNTDVHGGSFARWAKCIDAQDSTVTTSNNTFNDCDTGILANGGSAQASGSTFTNLSDAAVRANGANADLTDSTIDSASYGLVASGGLINVAGNTFRNVSTGVDVSDMTGDVHANTLSGLNTDDSVGLQLTSLTGNVTSNTLHTFWMAIGASGAYAVAGNTIENASMGIFASSSFGSISGNVLRNVTSEGISTNGDNMTIAANDVQAGYGILVYNEDNEVRDNAIEASHLGIQTRGARAYLHDNTITGADTGIFAQADPSIDSNTLIDNGFGIELWNSTATVTANVIHASGGAGSTGIESENHDESWIEGNQIDGYATGVRVTFSSPEVAYNTINATFEAASVVETEGARFDGNTMRGVGTSTFMGITVGQQDTTEDVLFQGNDISGFGWGAFVNAPGSTFDSNIIHDNEYVGIEVRESVNLVANTITGSNQGIRMTTGEAYATGNVFDQINQTGVVIFSGALYHGYQDQMYNVTSRGYWGLNGAIVDLSEVAIHGQNTAVPTGVQVDSGATFALYNVSAAGLARGVATYGGALSVDGIALDGNAYGFDLDVCAGTVTIQHARILNSTVVGISSNGCSTSVRTSSFSGNALAAASSFAGDLDARQNYWGASSGPHNASGNPSGTGDEVASTVTYSNWLTSPP